MKLTCLCLVFLLAVAGLADCGSTPPLPPLPAPASASPAEAAPSAVPGAASPEAAYRAYFAALRKGDHAAAAAWLSDYSLRVEGLARADVQERLKLGVYGALRYLDLQVQDVLPAGSALDGAPTAIIHSLVTLQQGVTAPRVQEQWNVARYEAGGWRVNAGDLIDAARAAVPAQTQHGVTVRLAGLQRYATHARLIFEVANANAQAAAWGGGPDPALILTSGGEVLQLPAPKFRFDARQSYPQIIVDVERSLAGYPSRVEMAGWSLAGTEQSPQWSYNFYVPAWQALR